MLDVPEFAAAALSNTELHDRQRDQAEDTKPSVFKVKGKLLDQGRTDTPLATTDELTIRLKIYASGGENELHAHPFEDHSFILLQGSAKFYGPEGETIELGPYEGIMLPKGSFYRFHATSDEPLVLLRVGTPNQIPKLSPNRIDPAGKPMGGDSKTNNSEFVRFRDGEYFG